MHLWKLEDNLQICPEDDLELLIFLLPDFSKAEITVLHICASSYLAYAVLGIEIRFCEC